jgi:hypothetical protein
MNTRKKLGLLGVMAAAIGIGSGVDLQTEPKRIKIKRSLSELNKRKGLKEFFYGENSIWAINQKNADRKARLRNLI